jgi:hypothetical protein
MKASAVSYKFTAGRHASVGEKPKYCLPIAFSTNEFIWRASEENSSEPATSIMTMGSIPESFVVIS